MRFLILYAALLSVASNHGYHAGQQNNGSKVKPTRTVSAKKVVKQDKNTVLLHQKHKTPIQLDVYYVPFNVETYEPMTPGSIKRMGLKLSIMDPNAIQYLFKLLSIRDKAEDVSNEPRPSLIETPLQRQMRAIEVVPGIFAPSADNFAGWPFQPSVTRMLVDRNKDLPPILVDRDRNLKCGDVQYRLSSNIISRIELLVRQYSK